MGLYMFEDTNNKISHVSNNSSYCTGYKWLLQWSNNIGSKVSKSYLISSVPQCLPA